MRSRGRKLSSILRVFFYSLGGALLLFAQFPHQASAQTSGYRAEWIDRGHVRVFEAHRGSEGVVFTDSNPDDNNNHFVNEDQPEDCRSSLSTPMSDSQQNYSGSPAKGILYSVVKTEADDSNAARCEVRFDKNGTHAKGELRGDSRGPLTGTNTALSRGKPTDNATKSVGREISIGKVGNGVINFRRASDTQLVSVAGDRTFTRGDNSNTYLEPGTKACRDSIIIEGSKTTEGKVVETGTYRHRSGDGAPCKIDSSTPATIMALSDPDMASLVTSGAVTDPGQDTPTCEGNGFSLAWILCPVINGLATASESIFDNFVKPFLQSSAINVTDTNDPIYKVWSSFRIIANILLVAALLIVVLGQSVGGGMIDAYTAKKIMPRLLAAAILVNISIYLVALMVDLTNILGEGVGKLITAPFGIDDFFTITPNFGTGAIGLTAIIGAGWVFASGPALMFLWTFVLMPALLAMIGVFVTLILRQGLILFLIIISPVAFGLYCLPNTEKYFKKWWDLLFKALMAYPVIVGLFALAHVLASLIGKANATSGPRATISQIAGIVVMLIPLFMIPFAFKMAGGAVASLYGAINGWSGKAKEGILGNPNDQGSMRNRARRNFGINRTVRGADWTQTQARFNPRNLSSAGRQRSSTQIDALKTSGLDQLRKQVEGTPLWQSTVGVDSNVGAALAFYRNGGEARAAAAQTHAADLAAAGGDQTKIDLANRQYNQRLSAVSIAERIGYNPATRRGALLNANTIGFEMAGGKEGWDHALTLMDDISGGDQFQFRSMMDEFQAIAKGNAGRTDLAANVDGNREYNLDRATGNHSLYQLLNGKPKSTTALIKQHAARLSSATASKEEKEKSATFLHEMRTAGTKNQGTAANRDAINENASLIDQAYGAYLDDRANQALGSSVPIARREVVEQTIPDPNNPGATITQRVPQTVNLRPSGTPQPAGINDAQRAEARRQQEKYIDSLSRAYTPPDPNNMQENH